MHKNKMRVIFVGRNFDSTLDKKIVEIKKKFEFFEDTEKQIFMYETGLMKPLLFEIGDFGCRLGKTIDDAEISEIEALLDEADEMGDEY